MKLIIVRKEQAHDLKEWVKDPGALKELGFTNDNPFTNKIFDEWFKGLVFYIENQGEVKIGFVFIQIIPDEKGSKFSGVFHIYILPGHRVAETGLEVFKKVKEKCFNELHFTNVYTLADTRASKYFDWSGRMKKENKKIQGYNLYSCGGKSCQRQS